MEWDANKTFLKANHKTLMFSKKDEIPNQVVTFPVVFSEYSSAHWALFSDAPT